MCRNAGPAPPFPKATYFAAPAQNWAQGKRGQKQEQILPFLWPPASAGRELAFNLRRRRQRQTHLVESANKTGLAKKTQKLRGVQTGVEETLAAAAAAAASQDPCVGRNVEDPRSEN